VAEGPNWGYLHTKAGFACERRKPWSNQPVSSSDEVTEGLLDVKETIQIRAAAMVRMNGALETHTELLKEILQAVTAEPEGESPIVVALHRLLDVGEANSVALARIEQLIGAR
jgi:hypothetical protein